MFEALSLRVNPYFIEVRGGRIILGFKGRTYLEVSFETSLSLLVVDNFDIDHSPSNILKTAAEGKPGLFRG